MKKLIAITTALALASMSAIPAARATGVAGDAKVPHVTGSGANPEDAHFYPSTYYFRLHVAGRSLSQLSIEIPQDVQFGKTIKVTDQSGKKFDATVSFESRKATIAFAQPIAPDTKLRIAINGVVNRFPKTEELSIMGRLEGLNAEIPLGTVRIPHYSR